jgi:hypothetical protein
MVESCRCSTSSHSPLSSSALYLCLAAFLVRLVGAEEGRGGLDTGLRSGAGGAGGGGLVPEPLGVNRGGLSLQPVSV